MRHINSSVIRHVMVVLTKLVIRLWSFVVTISFAGKQAHIMTHFPLAISARAH